jgi:prepilin-type processing-associated H-X9-DG protein
MDDGSKPLNKYLWKDVSDEPWLGAKAAPEQRRPRDVFRCPADKPDEGMGRGVGLPVNYLGPSVASPYELYGTSYMCNRGWMYDPEIIDLYYKCITLPLTHEKVNYLNNGVSKIAMHWPSAETYVAADLWFLWSLFYHQAVPGAHSKQSIHNAVFLDGHAAPAYVTQRDVERWGPRVPGQYTPKYGDGWRETRGTYNGSYTVGTSPNGKRAPWNGTDPFGGGTGQGVTGREQ